MRVRLVLSSRARLLAELGNWLLVYACRSFSPGFSWGVSGLAANGVLLALISQVVNVELATHEPLDLALIPWTTVGRVLDGALLLSEHGPIGHVGASLGTSHCPALN